MSEWKEYRMEDLIEEIAMGPFGSNIKVDCFTDKGIPVLNGSNLVGFKLNEDSFNYVTKEKADSLGHSNAYRNDIVVTHRGTLGQLVYIPKNSKYERYVISQSQFRFKCNSQLVDIPYLVYYFHSREGQYKLLANASQVGVPALARPTSTFKDIQISLPPLETQHRIASILTSLDDKIDLLRRENATLEAMAETLFRQWFVEEGKDEWKEVPLSSIASFLNGLACQKYPPKNETDKLPVLKIRELSSGIGSDSDWASTEVEEEYVVHAGDVIFAWSASLMVKIWDGEDCILNQHLFKVSSNKYPKWFYYFWCKHHLNEFVSIAQSHATTMGHIKRGDLDTAMVLVPSDKELLSMTTQMEGLLKKTQINNEQINTLIQTRNGLLPRLMNNEIKI